ncbi:L-type lectin-domain containing receptor kinase S.4-like [Corylus avellana]|uniref:L-type lectin-domain containing receptor kinase S.4-like n=1 Tax=Corylus avellana TaxID=13451 RepID=UPI00286D5F5D|nr:L-type lectin-domain containing receptor kinase S.4-like [Corylus avellana]
MDAENLVSIWVFLLFLYPVKSDLANGGLLLSGFSNGFSTSAARNNMSLNGFAAFENNGMLRLTNDSLQVVGHAFYSYPIQFKNSSGEVMSFSTAFAFAVITAHDQTGGDGLAFTISPTKELPRAAPGPYLGLFNASNDGNFSNHVFVVEFYTLKDPELHDLNDNHVGLDINSIVSKKSVPAMEFKGSDTNMRELDLKSGQIIQAWIEYNSQVNQLDVKVAQDSGRPRSILLSYTVNLSDILQESMYIGFSASTGSHASSHYILGWSFNMNGGDANNLYLDKLHQLPTGAKKNHTGLIVGVSVLGALAVILLIALTYYIFRRIREPLRLFLFDWMLYIVRWIHRNFLPEPWVDDLIDRPRRFSYNELKKATGGFNDTQIIGVGGFGRVYRGTLANSDTQVAVKRTSHGSKQGMREFVSEVASIGCLRHRYLIQLLGWCSRRNDLLLVYEFMPNGSLDKHLFDEPKTILSWEQRLRILKNVASGLSYLHEESHRKILHRDIKAGNVLLDSEFNGKLGDFGLAKLYEHGLHGYNASTTRLVGTMGYLAPELILTGMPTSSSDVFAFGALLLEVVCGRRPIDPKASLEEVALVSWVWEKWSLGKILDVVDPRLEGTFDPVEACLVLELGLICSNQSPEGRPTIIQVRRYLETGAEQDLDVCGGENLKRKLFGEMKNKFFKENTHKNKSFRGVLKYLGKLKPASTHKGGSIVD